MFRQIRSKTRFSNWVDLKKDWVALKKFSILLLPCRAIGSVLHRSHFFYYDKSRNGKRYPFANVNSFWYRMWNKTFCHLDRANSIKTALQTCNLSTGLSLSYKSVSWFWLNLQWHFAFTFANEYILAIRLLS